MLNSNRNLLQSFKPLQAFREKQEEAEEKKGWGMLYIFIWMSILDQKRILGIKGISRPFCFTTMRREALVPV